MDNFGFCVWLLVKNPSYWNSVRNRFANHITKFPLHITVQSGFTNKNDAFKYMKSYTMPTNVSITPWLRTDLCTIHNKSFHSVEAIVNIGEINNAHISLAYDINNKFNIKNTFYCKQLPTEYNDGYQLCVADARHENPELWEILV